MEVRKTPEIRKMSEQDLDEILEIERLSFPSPWSRILFERELATPFARSLVAQEAQREKILGYLCFWLVEQEAHILNLAVHPQHRNRGIGTLLLGYGVDDCRKEGVQAITLEVRRSNYKAISLYRGFHFQPLGIRRRYYPDSGEDAVVMGLALGETTSLSTV
ncbi:MAG: ribosomal protein S18-alanine N-acetyltransferase [Thermodesulfobacteriota bacterium]